MNAIKRLFRAAIPFLPSSVMSSIIRGRPYLAAEMPPGRSFVWTSHNGDISVLIDNSNAIEMSMMRANYDNDVSLTIERFVKRGDTCIDIGANVGAVTLTLAKAVGSTGRVIAIEPGPPYVARLKQNIALNKRFQSCIQIESVGIGDKPGVLVWEADPSHQFNAVLSPGGEWFASGKGIEVNVETLDSVVSRLGLKRLDFVKIDVESMELEVLRGADGVLRTLRPVVVFETMKWARDHRMNKSGVDVFSEIASLLKSLNYDAMSIGSQGLTPVNLESPADNTVAVPR